jgi:hypothetical protein
VKFIGTCLCFFGIALSFVGCSVNVARCAPGAWEYFNLARDWPTLLVLLAPVVIVVGITIRLRAALRSDQKP